LQEEERFERVEDRKSIFDMFAVIRVEKG